MALTETELHDLRRDIGDAQAKPRLSPDQLQRAFVLAKEDADVTRVIALRWLLGMIDSEHPDYKRTQDLLELWLKQANMTGGSLRTGVIDLGLESQESEWS